MAFKFVVLACALALANGSYIHGPMVHNYGPSTPQYGLQELRYQSNSGSSSQGPTSQDQSGENIIRNQGNGRGQLTSSQQKTVQINSGSYSLSGQGKSDVRVTNPGTYSTNNYNGSPAASGSHEQRVTYAPTPSYNQNNGYEHASSSYQQSTPVYGHSNNAGTVYGHHSVPVYQYVTSAYGIPAASSFAHNGNAYSQAGSSSSASTGILGVSYSPAVAVSHMSYSSPVGISYAW